MFSMCFPDEVPDYDLPMDLGYGTDEMDMIGLGRIFDAAPHGPHTVFDMFGVFVLETDKDDSIPDAYTDDCSWFTLFDYSDSTLFDTHGPFSLIPPFSILAIPPFWYSPDPSTILPRLHHFRCYLGPFSVLAGFTVRYSPGPFLILGPFSTRHDSTLSRYLLDPSPTCRTLLGTCGSNPNLSQASILRVESVGKLQHCGFEEESDSLSVLEVIIGMHGSYLVEILRNFLTELGIFYQPAEPVWNRFNRWLPLSAMRNTCLSLSGSHSSGLGIENRFFCLLP
ncbi:hypothetical protein AAG906_008994 [Vitis piasezkii]